jgi:hypothetical protein
MPEFRARCFACPWESIEPAQEIAQCMGSWHVYEEHPDIWRHVVGDRPPHDLDPRTADGLMQIMAGRGIFS